MDVCRLKELGRVRDELRKGRQAANNLLGLIRQQQKHLSTSSLNIPASSDLVVKIVDSFSNSLSIMLAGCQDPAGTGSRKSSSLSTGGRGRCKPRKGDLWTQVTSSVTGDGYAWKKYGQKSILNAKHPSPSSYGDKEEESAIQQPDSLPILGIMEPIAFPTDAEWSLDDFDYLLESVDFNDHKAF